jgi:hypothetical protein
MLCLPSLIASPKTPQKKSFELFSNFPLHDIPCAYDVEMHTITLEIRTLTLEMHNLTLEMQILELHLLYYLE